GVRATITDVRFSEAHVRHARREKGAVDSDSGVDRHADARPKTCRLTPRPQDRRVDPMGIALDVVDELLVAVEHRADARGHPWQTARGLERDRVVTVVERDPGALDVPREDTERV